MKKISSTLLAVSAAAMLAACGGGDDVVGVDPAPVAPVAAVVPVVPTPTTPLIGNAGVFVPSNQSAARINLSHCRYTPQQASVQPITIGGFASLQIAPNGDMTFAQDGDTANSVAAISQTIVASSASEAKLEIAVTNSTTQQYDYNAGLIDSNQTDAVQFQFDSNYGYTSTGPVRSHNVDFRVGNTQFYCGIVSGAVVTANFGDFNSRIAAATSGIRSIRAPIAYPQLRVDIPSSCLYEWQNHATNMTHYIRLNASTGEISAATSAAGTYTPINLAGELITANGANRPAYKERKDSSGQYISFDTAQPGSIKNFSFMVNANTLTPSPRY